MATTSHGERPASALRHWQRARAATLLLLLLWSAVTVGTIWFARELTFSFFGWPFGYWAVAQGALLVYLLLIAAYAAVMSALDRTQARLAQPTGEGR